jgi:hypothetical protein
MFRILLFWRPHSKHLNIRDNCDGGLTPVASGRGKATFTQQ